MPWRFAVCLTVALIAVTCAQIITIEDNINQESVPTTNDTDTTTTQSTVKEYDTHDTTTTIRPSIKEHDLLPFDTEENDLLDTNETDTSGKDGDSENETNIQSESIEEIVENVDSSSPGESSHSSRSSELAGTDEDSTDDEDTDESSPELSPASDEVQSNLVETPYGSIQGHTLATSPEIVRFYDIPYGVYSHPFHEATPPEVWDEVHDVAEHTKRCPQLDSSGTYVGQVDCLTISVFKPASVENASVLFHIHDGDFVSGSGDPAIYGPEHLVSNGIILVLPNYRLGPLGFLCLQNTTAPGNAALKDLTLALEWTRCNIQYFGGDSTKITVSGDGKSGALAGFLAISPKSKYYVNHVITESGFILSDWAFDRTPVKTATIIADKIRENLENSPDNLYQTVDIQTLFTASKDVPLRPCIEADTADAFMSKSPWAMLQEWNTSYTATAFMLGAADHAGMQEAALQTENGIEDLNESGLTLPDDLAFNTDEEKTEVQRKLKYIYFGNRNITMDGLSDLSLSYTDARYLNPLVRASRVLVKAGGNVYFYEFSFVGQLNRESISINSPVQGAAKGDIKGYIFTQDEHIPAEGTPEQQMIDVMTQLWVSYIKTGIPTTHKAAWHALEDTTVAQEEWLSIGCEVRQERGIHETRLQLWTQIYDKHFIENFGFVLGSRGYYLFALPIIVSLLF